MTKRRNIKLFAVAALAASTLAMSACSSVVSEEACEAGNWESIGFKDGSNGKSADRLSKIVESCTEYGLSVDNQAWLKGYEAGLPRYCTYERGYERGESGSSYNQVCGGELAEAYAPGYDEGRQRYAVYRKYEELVDRYEYKRERLYDTRQRLQDPDLTDRQKDRLRRNIRRLEYELDNLRYNVQQFARRKNTTRRSTNRRNDRDYRF